MAVECVKLEVDVAELPLDVRDILAELHIHVRDAGEGERANSVVRGGSGIKRLVLGDRVLDWTSDELLNLLRCGTRPGTEGHCDPDGNVRVLPLGHASVAKPTPYKDTDEEHPRDLGMFHEKSGNVVALLDPILVACVFHGPFYLREHCDGIAIFQKLRADGDNSLSGLDPFDSN